MNIKMKPDYLSDHQIEMAVRNEVVRIKDIMPPAIRNVQVRIVSSKSKIPAGMFEHIQETVFVNPDDARLAPDPLERLKFVLWHEYRHALQHTKGILKMKNREIVWNNSRPVPVSDVIQKLYFDPDGYNTLPWELDANACAAEYVPDYREEMPFGAYKRRNIELRTLF